MLDKIKSIKLTLGFLRSVILSGESYTDEVRNAINDSFEILREIEKEQQFYKFSKSTFTPEEWSKNPQLFKCVNCGEKSITKNQNYCHHCGIKLRWKNEEGI